jgi:hypothetical protein
LKKFSFLHKDRFQKIDKKYASDYHGCITWVDGHKTEENNLQTHADTASIEYVKYLPQKFIESVCNDINDEFQSEINHVIFSFIPESEKGDARNLTELLKRKYREFETDNAKMCQELKVINESIIILEDKSSPKYKNDCE